MAKIVVKTEKTASQVAIGVNQAIGGISHPVTERAEGEYIIRLDKGQKVLYDKMSDEARKEAFGGKTSELLEG